MEIINLSGKKSEYVSPFYPPPPANVHDTETILAIEAQIENIYKDSRIWQMKRFRARKWMKQRKMLMGYN